MSAVRQARLEDAGAIARIEVETWRSTYSGMVPDRVLLGMSERRQAGSWAGLLRLRPEDVWVAQDADDRIVGFGNCGGQRDSALDFDGEVYTLYVTGDAQGRGLGRQLLLALFGRLVYCGFHSALVWVVRANPARYFYERLGGRLALHRPIPVGGKLVEAVAYGWRDVAAVVEGRARSGNGLAGDAPLR